MKDYSLINEKTKNKIINRKLYDFNDYSYGIQFILCNFAAFFRTIT